MYRLGRFGESFAADTAAITALSPVLQPCTLAGCLSDWRFDGGNLPRSLTFPIRSAEDVTFGRHHYVVEVLREHRRREESDRAQCFFTDIDEVVL